MRITRALIVFAAASALMLSGCSGDGGGETTKETDSGAGGADAGASSSGGSDAGASSSSGGSDAGASSSSGGSDAAASSSGGGDAATSSSSGGADAGSDKKYNNCPSLGDCVVSSCVKTGFAADCEKSCLADASGGALQSSATLLQCAKDECIAKKCKDEDAADKASCVMDCIPEKCGAGLLICLNDKDAKGDKPCGSAFDCFEKCDGKDGKPFTCQAGCYNALDADGKKYLAAMLKAMGENGGDIEKCGEKCIKPMITCLNNGKPGNGTCVQTLQCAQKCDSDGGDTKPTDGGGGGKQPGGDNHDKKDGGGEMCMFACLAKASEKAATDFFGASECFGEEAKAGCGEKILACIDPQGPGKCIEVMPCVGKCVADKTKAGEKGDLGAACSFECLAKTTKEGAAAFWAISAKCDDGKGDEPPKSGGDGPGMPGEASGTMDMPPPACIDAVATCAGNTKDGDDCVKMGGCIGQCEKAGGGDNAQLGCILGCVSKSSEQAHKDFKKIAECTHTCAKMCEKDADPKKCNEGCWAKDAGCMTAQKACAPPK